MDFEMRQMQRVWVNRISNFYQMLMGILTGMSLMHLVLLLFLGDKEQFVASYQPFSNIIVCVTSIIANFIMVFGTAQLIIFKQKADEKMRNMDKYRREFRQQFDNALVQLFFVLIAWIILNIEPKFTNMFYFYSADEISEGDISLFKVLNYAKTLVLTVAWIITSCCNRSAVNSMDLDPEDAQAS
mmetsp:Transcript_11774/g.19867  ORF Transcript_11774/g.19867 Transcript_11774/m.19867 type:complete len:185 (+) Transcript_11774:414-968(+)